MRCIYTIEYYLAIRKNEIMQQYEQTQNYHTKQSKPEKERQISYITHMWNLKKKFIQMNLFIKQKQTHIHRKQTYDYQKGKGRGDKLGVWD